MFTTDNQKDCLMVDYPRHCFSEMLDKTKRQEIRNSNSHVSPCAIFIAVKKLDLFLKREVTEVTFKNPFNMCHFKHQILR